jgi:hypothetical protein
MLFIGLSYSGAHLSDSVAVTGNAFIAEQSSNYDVVLNEVYANPIGDEAATMPGGEWLELYNKGHWPIDVNGWYLYDALVSHDFKISTVNVLSGSTVIAPRGYLVIYRNGDADFSLNNGSETVRLYDDSLLVGNLIDSFSYMNTQESKSWSTIPDGTDIWSDGHVPTPGGPNV